jgi:hypothetical protein
MGMPVKDMKSNKSTTVFSHYEKENPFIPFIGQFISGPLPSIRLFPKGQTDFQKTVNFKAFRVSSILPF